MARPIDDDGCHGASQGAAAVGTARHKRGKDGAVSVLEPSTSRELRELIIRSCSSHRRSYWGFSAGERRVRRRPMVLVGVGRWCLQAAGMAMAVGAKAAAVVPTQRRRGARRRSPSDLRLLAGSGGWPAVVIGDGG
uniref:Uncharacterized protein n=1 Tax=Oryza barthii TaxID=65489 RepID=A0A0D3FFI9_9ORYZ